MNFVHTLVSEKDIDLFLGPVENGEIPQRFGDRETMAHIMHRAGLFKSISEARKNGWNKPVPRGFTEHTVGKLKKKIWTLHTSWMSANERHESSVLATIGLLSLR